MNFFKKPGLVMKFVELICEMFDILLSKINFHALLKPLYILQMNYFTYKPVLSFMQTEIRVTITLFEVTWDHVGNHQWIATLLICCKTRRL